MKLQISDLKTERQWRAATGLDQSRFEKFLGLFTTSYLSLYGQPVADRQAELEVTPSLTSEAELLFFTLFSLKASLTYDQGERIINSRINGFEVQNFQQVSSSSAARKRLVLTPAFEGLFLL